MHRKIQKILDSTRKRVESCEKNVDRVDSRSFENSLNSVSSKGNVPIIAEIKPTSPTIDAVNTDDPVKIANQMVEGGACALSVLTEPIYFGGSLENLSKVRDSVDVPVLRKDFILDKRQLYEIETDMVLLIAAFLDDLEEFVDEAISIGFQPLVEVHTFEELEYALKTDAELIGVNNRDLSRLKVDLNVGENILPHVPRDRIAVSESGISNVEDLKRMIRAGADAFLIGTSIMQHRGVGVVEKTRMFTECLNE